MRYYNGFKVLKRNIDIVPMSADYSIYERIIASNVHLVDDSTVKRLELFIPESEILVLNYRAGIQHKDASTRRVVPPGAFAEIVGVIAEAKLDLVDYFAPGKQFGIRFSTTETDFRSRTILESLTLRDSETIARLRRGWMAGQPATTRNRHGRGCVFYVGTDCADDVFHETLAQSAAAFGKLRPLIPAPCDVEVTTRDVATTTYYFLLNLTEVAHNSVAMPSRQDDLLSERKGLTEVSPGPLEVAALASPK
jgi:beta-galactosidase